MTDADGSRVSSGIPGLDEVLSGGFVDERTYTVRGTSGTGKTILGYHFLTAGVDEGERSLYLAFEETADDIVANAASLGIDLSGVVVEDLSPSPTQFLEDEGYTVFGPGEVEGHEMVSRIAEAIETHDPDRVFIDPLTLLRHLSPDEYQFKRMAASMTSYLKQRGTTTLFTTQPTLAESDEDLQYLSDGSITLERSEYGRDLTVDKFRGSDFRSGRHSFRIDGDGGITVFPSLDPTEFDQESSYETLSSGIDSLDLLLGGGIEQGSITLVSGPSGVGKSTTGMAFLRAAADRGEPVTAYLLEETASSFRHRSNALGYDIDALEADGTFRLSEVEPVTVSADEFADTVRRDVDARDTEMVLLDGTAGYRMALRDETEGLETELNALCRYLRNRGVTVLLTDEVRSVTGSFQASDSRLSYLADNVVFIRYIEVDGEIQKAIGVLKKRFGDFEATLRQFRIESDGIAVGETLDDLRGILTGTPTRRVE
ncbi:AAA family ATPase [Halomicroarcula sp. F13]|uniref:non-specific serine/threonine protein kinase n=1 Tax=Haloarcula rubra TaxID=2487747 RepID=A0AAW4PS36_9EURY|nr:ATPase domain-containing protein [Halomicroarcula rubra]MBX0323355.1 AAA family ATPase [Halomicroarcula rubra]